MNKKMTANLHLKTIIPVRDFEHKGETLKKGKEYQLDYRNADVLVSSGIAYFPTGQTVEHPMKKMRKEFGEAE